MIKKNCLSCKYLIKAENGFYHCEKVSSIFGDPRPCYYYTPKGLSKKEEQLYHILRTIAMPIVVVSLPKELIGALGKLKKLGIVKEGYVKVNEYNENKVGIVSYRTRVLKTVCLREEFL